MNKLKHFSKFLIIFLLISHLGLPVFSNNVRITQELLTELGYDPGVIDGAWGSKTEAALIKFLSSKKLAWDGNLDFSELKHLSKAVSENLKIRGNNWRFHDQFNEIRWAEGYDKKLLPKNVIKKGFAKIETELNGNNYISLTSEIGQVAHWNNKKNPFLKDRVELSNPVSRTVRSIDKNIFWYGFKVKSPEQKGSPIFMPVADIIAITQFFQIHKDHNKKTCNTDPFFRIHVKNDGRTLISVVDAANEKILKKYIPTFINSNNWSKVKIGIRLSEKNQGWVSIYLNQKLIYKYFGQTILSFAESCKRPQKWSTNKLAVGLYRSIHRSRINSLSTSGSNADTLHFDDFIVSNYEVNVDAAFDY